MLLYGVALAIIDHFVSLSLLPSLRLQMCLETSVLFPYFLLRKDSLCCVTLDLSPANYPLPEQ